MKQAGQGALRPLSERIPRRAVVVGTTGSGKTTLAANLANLLLAKHIELDALHWGPNWTPVPDQVFRRRVANAVADERWVADGNYSKVRDLTWNRVDVWIWLDYSYPRVLWRLTARTWRRVRFREELWSGNRESLRQLFFDWHEGLFVSKFESAPPRSTDGVSSIDQGTGV